MQMNKLDLAIDAALKSSDFIMEIYDKKYDVDYKDGDQPVTTADKGSHDIIIKTLSKSGYPIISEESSNEIKEKIIEYDKFWLIDPLDGTKEFIKKNGEFAVLISFVENKESTLGVMYFPTTDTLYYSEKGTDAIKINKYRTEHIKTKLEVKFKGSNDIIYLTSRSNKNEKTYEFVNNDKYNFTEESYGASVKFAKFLDNEADIYFRYCGEICANQWDLCAPHCIIKSAGGEVLNMDDREEIKYGNSQMTLKSFIIKHPKLDL